MEHYKFYQNRECEYFPCHEGVAGEDFNCLFCYCPLYALGDQCGGSFEYLDNGIKDCSRCVGPTGGKITTGSWKRWNGCWNWRKSLDFFRYRWYNSPREYGGVLKWSKRRDSKSRRPVTGCKGSNPFSSAKNRIPRLGVLFF